MATYSSKNIEAAAAKALDVIAQAANKATETVAQAAADAAKVKAVEVSSDHDSLTELKVLVVGIKADIKELADGTSVRISRLESDKLNISDSYPLVYKAAVEEALKGQETRLRAIEIRIAQILTWGTAGLILLGVAEFLINKLVK